MNKLSLSKKETQLLCNKIYKIRVNEIFFLLLLAPPNGKTILIPPKGGNFYLKWCTTVFFTPKEGRTFISKDLLLFFLTKLNQKNSFKCKKIH